MLIEDAELNRFSSTPFIYENNFFCFLKPGHKYMFGEEALNWEEAREMCELQSGWLVDINSIHEQNCLIRHALATEGLNGLNYWTDGNHYKV